MSRATQDITTDVLFPGVDRAMAQRFLDQLQLLEASAGDVLFREGDPGDTLLILLSGQLSLRCDTPADEVVELARISAGDVVGELAVLSPAPRSATAVAVTAIRALVVTRATFNGLLTRRDPAVEALLMAITRRICRRLRQTDARIALLQDALRGASPLDLVTRIRGVVEDDAITPTEGDNWSSRLATHLRRGPS